MPHTVRADSTTNLVDAFRQRTAIMHQPDATPPRTSVTEITTKAIGRVPRKRERVTSNGFIETDPARAVTSRPRLSLRVGSDKELTFHKHNSLTLSHGSGAIV